MIRLATLLLAAACRWTLPSFFLVLFFHGATNQPLLGYIAAVPRGIAGCVGKGHCVRFCLLHCVTWSLCAQDWLPTCACHRSCFSRGGPAKPWPCAQALLAESTAVLERGDSCRWSLALCLCCTAAPNLLLCLHAVILAGKIYCCACTQSFCRLLLLWTCTRHVAIRLPD